MRMTCRRCGWVSEIPDEDDESETAQAVADHYSHRCVSDEDLAAQQDVGIFGLDED